MPAVSYSRWPIAVAPGPLEVAPQDGGQAAGAGAIVACRVGGHARSGLLVGGADRVYGPAHGHRGERDSGARPPASIRPMVDFTLTDENRLVQQSARAFAEAEILPYIREWDEKGEVHRELFEKMGEQGFLGAPIPEAYGGAGMDYISFAHPVRGAGACRHRVPRRPERPRRAQLADAPPVGDRGAAPALARPAGARREARDVRPDRARRRHRRRPTSRRRPGATATPTGSTARRSGSPSPTSPTTSWSSPRSTGRRSTRA